MKNPVTLFWSKVGAETTRPLTKGEMKKYRLTYDGTGSGFGRKSWFYFRGKRNG